MADPADIAVAEALWKQVEESFAQDAPHAAYLAHCHKAALLPEAARRYRAMKDDLPEDDPKRAQIDKRLAAVAFMAMAALDDKRSAPKPRARTLFTIMAALIMVAAMIGLLRALML